MKRTTSSYIAVRKSNIHSRGVFASKNIPAGTRVIEYVGEKITKAESERRAEIVLNANKCDSAKGAVYIFTLNKRFDIDGNVPHNTARLINHSCDPNCEAQLVAGHIWIASIKDIKRGEELTYNYGYDFEDYEEHLCRCGAPHCVGYILAEEHWPKLKARHLTRRPRRKLLHEEIVSQQEKNRRKPRVPLILVLDNIRSAHNVGAAFRTADGAGIEKIYLCGITAYPPNRQIDKTALGAQDYVSWEYRANVADVLNDIKRRGYQIVILEQTDTSFEYADFEAKHPVCLIIGNEIEGVSDEAVSLADRAMEIPMFGEKNSLNVSVACGIALYHISHSLRAHLKS
ncbi:MAG: TrmH family RNA methyltransferase [Candidatus Omnitrophota bacterium]